MHYHSPLEILNRLIEVPYYNINYAPLLNEKYVLFWNTIEELEDYYAEFEEEVLAEDGEVEEYFGFDRSALWVLYIPIVSTMYVG